MVQPALGDKAAAKRVMVTRFYHLAPPHAADASAYVEVIRHLVTPKTWTGGNAFLGSVPGAIVVRCPPATQARIRALLNNLEAPLAVPPNGSGVSAAGLGFGGSF